MVLLPGVEVRRLRLESMAFMAAKAAGWFIAAGNRLPNANGLGIFLGNMVVELLVLSEAC